MRGQVPSGTTRSEHSRSKISVLQGFTIKNWCVGFIQATHLVLALSIAPTPVTATPVHATIPAASPEPETLALSEIWKYVGCYRSEGPDRVWGSTPRYRSSWEDCSLRAISEGHDIFGMEYYDTTGDAACALVGEAYQNMVRGADIECEVELFEEKHLGGANRLAIYSARSPNGAFLARRLSVPTKSSPMRTIATPHEHVYGVDFSPDGASVVTCGLMGDVMIRDATTGAIRQSFNGTTTGHTYGHDDATWVSACRYSPDGVWVLSCGNEKKGRIWNAATAVEHMNFEHGADIFDCSFSPDGAFVLTGGRNLHAKIWDVATGANIVSFSDHDSAVAGVAWSPDGASVATVDASKPAVVRIWDVVTGQVRLRFDTLACDSYTVDWSPDGASLATGGFRRAAFDRTGCASKIWDAATGAERVSLVSAVQPAIFSPDSRMVLVQMANQPRIYDAAAGDEVVRFSGHGSISRCGAAFSADGTKFVASAGGNVMIWDIGDVASSRTLTDCQGGSNNVCLRRRMSNG